MRRRDETCERQARREIGAVGPRSFEQACKMEEKIVSKFRNELQGAGDLGSLTLDPVLHACLDRPSCNQ
jgi:hypothetical protein